MKNITKIWKTVKGFEDYEVSNLGDVRRGEYVLKGYKTGKSLNYTTVRLYNKLYKKGKNLKVYRLVAEAFIPNPDNLPQVNHISGDTDDNSVFNLEWCDNSHNQKHAWKNGLNHFSENSFSIGNVSFLSNVAYCNPVVMFDKNYNFIEFFGSIENATSKANYSSIRKCCKLETYLANGYKWRYIKDCTFKNKIIVILGKTASGKTYILNKLKEKYNLNNFISHTNRDIRKNEKNNYDYYFVDESEIKEIATKCNFLDLKKYETKYGYWYYGLHINEIYKDKGICILDIDGLKMLKNKIGKNNIISIYIDADKEIRYNRSLNRDSIDSKKYNEILRRLDSDEKDFKKEDIINECDYIYKNNNISDLENIIYNIGNIINKNKSQKDYFVYPTNFKNGELKFNNKFYTSFKEWTDDMGFNNNRARYLKSKGKSIDDIYNLLNSKEPHCI